MKCIYLRTNKVNGKQYVGQTQDFIKRECDWGKTKTPYAGVYINQARKKYGINNWSVEILMECDTQDELNYWEKYYIKTLNTKAPNGYNLTDGGEGREGYKLSKESREKISKAHKGIGLGIKRPDHAERMKGENNPFYGRTHSPETVAKIIAANKGKTPHNKGKTYEEQFGKEKAMELKQKCINNNVPVDQIDKITGEVLRTWNSGKDASRELRVEYTNINKCTNNKQKTAFGYVWKKIKGDRITL